MHLTATAEGEVNREVAVRGVLTERLLLASATQ